MYFKRHLYKVRKPLLLLFKFILDFFSICFMIFCDFDDFHNLFSFTCVSMDYMCPRVYVTCGLC